MKTGILRTVLTGTILLRSLFVSGQTGNLSAVATVNDKFDKLFLSENFDSTNGNWSTVSNSENLVVVQDGEYILQRKASSAPFATMGNFNNTLSAYRLVTSLKLEKAGGENSSVGLIFMAQSGGQGGFIFEINKNQEFRLRQIAGNTYKYLTGSSKDGGWIKSTLVKGLNLPNLVEVRCAEKKYDLYLNSSLVMNFGEITYKSGDIGFIVGPSSKGKVDFIYIFSNQKNIDGDAALSSESTTPSLQPENDVMALAESIIRLKTQINQLTEENEDQKQMIESLKSASKEQETETGTLQKRIKAQDNEIKKMQLTYDSLLKVNTDLLKYKEMVKGNDNGDLVINLSKNLKAEKLRNEELSKTIQQLKDSLNAAPKGDPKQGKPAGNGTSAPKVISKPSDSTKKNEFVLPQEH